MDRSIGEAMRDARVSCGLTQDQAAKESGTSQWLITRLETNKSMANLSTLLKLSQAYSVTVSELIGEA